MVNNTNRVILYSEVGESELDELLAGRAVSGASSFEPWFRPSGPRHGMVGVIWERREGSQHLAHPLVIVCHEDEVRRLCGRYAQLHSDLSPLTAWCHLIAPSFFESLDSLTRLPDLGGLEAAWIGMIVAEAVLLAAKPLSSIRISACLATQSFAIARTSALWPHIPIKDARARFEIANRLSRSEAGASKVDGRSAKVRDSLEPLWETLVVLSRGGHATKSGEFGPIIESLESLQRARTEKREDEATYLIRYLGEYVPEARGFEHLEELSPESRLKVFDSLISELKDSKGDRLKLRRVALALLAGYLATVAAGGATSLSLAEDIALDFPEVTAWAYLVGGIGENVVWTSGFDGLGRLVARELLRPFRLDDSPTCDFSLDEANVLVDAKLSDPLVHLRVKQARLLTMSLVPGVNVQLPLSESVASKSGRGEPIHRVVSGDRSDRRDSISAFVDAFWPHIQDRVDDYLRNRLDVEAQRTREKSRTESQRQPTGKGSKRF